MKKMGTFFDEMIHITFECVVHLYGYRNKVMLPMKLFILVDLSYGAKFFIIAPSNWVMTFEIIVSYVKSIINTSTTKTYHLRSCKDWLIMKYICIIILSLHTKCSLSWAKAYITCWMMLRVTIHVDNSLPVGLMLAAVAVAITAAIVLDHRWRISELPPLCGNVEISFCLQFLHCLSTLSNLWLPQPAAGAPGGGWRR